jgi:hypothetical protein
VRKRRDQLLSKSRLPRDLVLGVDTSVKANLRERVAAPESRLDNFAQVFPTWHLDREVLLIVRPVGDVLRVEASNSICNLRVLTSAWRCASNGPRGTEETFVQHF